MFKVVLFLFVTFLARRSFGYLPENMATVAGQPFNMSCGIPSGDGLIRWKFQPIGNHEAKLLFNGYNISKGLPKHFISSFITGEFHLGNHNSSMEDAGTYQCIQTNRGSHRKQIGIAQLIVFSSASKCDSNASNGTSVEGDHVRMSCRVSYFGNLTPVMEWSRDDGSRPIIDSDATYSTATYPFNLTTTILKMMVPSDRVVTYNCKTFFKTPEIFQEQSDAVIARNPPEFINECSLKISVLHGPRNLSITPLRNTYSMDDRLHCTASGNPPPTYSWSDDYTGHVVYGSILTVTDTMEQRRINIYRCSAENIVAGEKKTVSSTIAFTVADTELDSSTARSLIVIVGTGAAVGGITVTVVGVVLWILVNRKCNNQPEMKGCEERRCSPHDYDSVNSGDIDSIQQTPDIELGQQSNMVNETVNRSTNEAEDLSPTETVNHYDTLVGCHTMQEPRPYSTLDTSESRGSN